MNLENTKEETKKKKKDEILQAYTEELVQFKGSYNFKKSTVLRITILYMAT